MYDQHHVVPGMALLVPICATIVGIGVAAVIRRHARRRRLARPWLWAAAVGSGFILGPVALRSTLRPVYAHTFTSGSSLALAFKPPEALATYLVGGSAVGVAVLAAYLWYCCLVLTRRERAA